MIAPQEGSALPLPPPKAGPVATGGRSWWRLVIGLGLLTLLVALIGPISLIATLGRVSPVWIGVISLLALTWLLLGAVNIWLLLRRLTPVGISDVASAYVTGWALSLIVPGQLGDAGQVLLLQRAGIPLAFSGAAYVVDKVVSLVWLALVASYGLALYAPRGVLFVFLVILAGGAITLFAIITLAPSHGTRTGRLNRFMQVFRAVLEHSRVLHGRPGAVVSNLGITVVKWLVMAGLYLGAFAALNGSIGFQAAATIPVISSLVGYLPITIAGAGTTELTAILLFKRVGAPATVVLGAYLLLRVVLAFWALILIWTLRSGRINPATR